MKIIQQRVKTDLALHLVGACTGYKRESLETVGRFLSPCQSAAFRVERADTEWLLNDIEQEAITQIFTVPIV